MNADMPEAPRKIYGTTEGLGERLWMDAEKDAPQEGKAQRKGFATFH